MQTTEIRAARLRMWFDHDASHIADGWPGLTTRLERRAMSMTARYQYNPERQGQNLIDVPLLELASGESALTDWLRPFLIASVPMIF